MIKQIRAFGTVETSIPGCDISKVSVCVKKQSLFGKKNCISGVIVGILCSETVSMLSSVILLHLLSSISVFYLRVAMLTSLLSLAQRSFHFPYNVSDFAGEGVGLDFASSRRAEITPSSPFLAAMASRSSCLASPLLAAEAAAAAGNSFE